MTEAYNDYYLNQASYCPKKDDTNYIKKDYGFLKPEETQYYQVKKTKARIVTYVRKSN